MADNEQVNVEAIPQIGQTPQGQIVSETPVATPVGRHNLWGIWGSWLGDPETRYGRRTKSWNIPTSVKLEMMNDPIVGLCYGFIAAKLVNATYEIRCADEEKRRFFQAMYDRIHQEFILQAAPSILLGSLGLVKQFKFATPQPLDPEASPAWTVETTPYILAGFEQIHPANGSPTFDNEMHKFTGVNRESGHVPAFFSLWLTMGKARAFGGYGGHGRLNYVYGDWWLKQFSRDLWILHLQKSIDRVVQMGYPEGTHSDGRSYRDIALDVGDSIRSGATVALPSTVYEVPDPMTGQMKPTTVRKWTAGFMQAGENVGAFHDMDDHLDMKMSLGMFVPPQAYLNVKQSALGGPTTADVLGELAVDLLLIDAVDIDTHLNKYVFPIVDRLNFPPGSPPVEKRTTGLVDKDRNDIMEVVKILAGRMDSQVPYIIDVKRALERIGMPLVEAADGEEGEGTETVTPAAGSIALRASRKKAIPQEVLERIAQETLPDDADEAAEVDADDLSREVARLKRMLPELFDSEI